MDRRRGSICNFLVNCPQGTFFFFFLVYIDTSEFSKRLFFIFVLFFFFLEMLDNVVETVGEKKVVQEITDNASNYKTSGEMLIEKRKMLF